MGYLNLIRYYLLHPSLFFSLLCFGNIHVFRSLLKNHFLWKYALNLFSTQNSSLVSLAMAATLLHCKYCLASSCFHLWFLPFNTLPLVLPTPIHWPPHHLRAFVLCFRKSKSRDSFSGVALEAPCLREALCLVIINLSMWALCKALQCLSHSCKWSPNCQSSLYMDSA